MTITSIVLFVGSKQYVNHYKNFITFYTNDFKERTRRRIEREGARERVGLSYNKILATLNFLRVWKLLDILESRSLDVVFFAESLQES